MTGNIKSKKDTFVELQKIMQNRYQGELSIAQRFTSSKNSYMGNGTFYKRSFSLIEKKEIFLSAFHKYFSSEIKSYEEVGRTLFHLTFTIGGKQVSFLNTHFAWGGNHIEKSHQTKQGEILLKYLKKVNPPFVLTGDFNLTSEQPLMKKITFFARSLTEENHLTNTLDPINHHAKHLFPKGLAVDYIFTSRDISVKIFVVIKESLSDHFGLTAELEI